MGYTGFLLIGSPDKDIFTEKIENKMKLTYDNFAKKYNNFPLVGDDDLNCFEKAELKLFKKFTKEFPDYTFIIYHFSETGGGSLLQVYKLKNNKLLKEDTFDLDNTYTELGDYSFFTRSAVDQTYVKDNITIVFNPDYGYE